MVDMVDMVDMVNMVDIERSFGENLQNHGGDG